MSRLPCFSFDLPLVEDSAISWCLGGCLLVAGLISRRILDKRETLLTVTLLSVACSSHALIHRPMNATGGDAGASAGQAGERAAATAGADRPRGLHASVCQVNVGLDECVNTIDYAGATLSCVVVGSRVECKVGDSLTLQRCTQMYQLEAQGSAHILTHCPLVMFLQSTAQGASSSPAPCALALFIHQSVQDGQFLCLPSISLCLLIMGGSREDANSPACSFLTFAAMLFPC